MRVDHGSQRLSQRSGAVEPDRAEGGVGAPAQPLLDRGRELAQLRAAVQALAGGTGGACLIEGGPGIGKTRLLREVRGMAAGAGLRSFSARGGELEGAFAFGVVRQLFEKIVMAPDAQARWLHGSAAAVAPVFEASSDLASGSEDALFAVLHALYWLVVNLAAEGPLLLAVDDLQWSDRASLRSLAHVVRRLEDLPVLLVACVRTSEQGTAPSLVAEIAHDPSTVMLRPRPLGRGATEELITGHLGKEPAPSFVTACHHATGGNPLLLYELLRSLSEEGVTPDEAHVDEIRHIGPRALGRTVLHRLARLPPDAVAMARAVAILGDGARLSMISRLAELDETSVAAAGQLLVDAEIMRPEQPVGFVHPLVREAVYHELAPVARERLHARAAALLAEFGAATEQVAAQLLMVGPAGATWVVDLLRDAGREAMRKGAPESAIAYLRRALDEPASDRDRPLLLLELGMAEAHVDGTAAAAHLRAALDGLASPADRAVATRTLARTLLTTRPPQETRAVAEAGAAELSDEYQDLRLELEATALFATQLWAAPAGDVSDRLIRARAIPVPPSIGARMMAAVAGSVWALTGGGTSASCVELALGILRGGDLIAADPGLMALLPIGVLVAAERDEGLRLLDQALASARRLGSLDAVAAVLIWRGWSWLERGELAEAQDSLQQALDASRLWYPTGSQGFSHGAGWLARVLVERGDLNAAQELLDQCPALVPGSIAEGLCLRSRVELLLAAGKVSEASVEADRYADRHRWIENPGWAPWRSLKAEILSRSGSQGKAIDLLEEELARARRWGAPGPVGRALRLLGSVRRNLDLLCEAVETTVSSAARLEHAKALAAYGAALRRHRRPTEARDPLRRALELATHCDASPLIAHVRSELLASGARLRGHPLTGPGSLTPSERRVVELAAAGRSNRDIAETLYITPKTVETHLSTSYQKLGIRSRRELPGVLEDPE